MKTIKLFFVLIYSLLWTLPTFPEALRLHKEGRQKELQALLTKLGNGWGRMLVEATGSTVTVTGAEKVPQDRAVVIVANHQGNFDIPVLLGYFPKAAAYIAKEEIRKLPILGKWNELYGTVFIKRKNPREALRAIQEGAQRVKDGYSLVIFPEGTRSPDGHVLPFKAGALKLAQKSGAPIIPVTLINTRTIMVKNSLKIRRADVRVIIGDPIDPNSDISNDLATVIQEQIAANLEMWQEFDQ